MTTVNCIGNRRLEVSRREDGKYELRIMLKRRTDKYIATLVIEAAEFEKLRKIA